MKVNILIFIIGFIAAFASGYLIFDGPEQSAGLTASETPSDAEEEEQQYEGIDSADSEGATTIPVEAEALGQNNCLSCHAVESLGAEGGTTGPDLSQAFNDVEGKHRKSLDEFLQEPTSAVMSTVIADNPLEDDERKQIIKALQEAAEN
ncbi:c-type cytochrome [Virgibacillus byunsanensis]|uniref:C-type cytochrome n=1 Tax=Virgibacillus byunsanensis TaxID=570945 RepID=A0ABW3LRB2_9BACI